MNKIYLDNGLVEVPAFPFCSLILSALWSEVTVQINVFHYIDGKLGALWTSEYESEFEEQYMEI